MPGEPDKQAPIPTLRHVISNNYVYLQPVGFVFFHISERKSVGLTYYHDEMRIVGETLASSDKQPQYLTQPVRIQDATVVVEEDDYVRNVRETLELIEQTRPELLAKYGIAISKATT